MTDRIPKPDGIDPRLDSPTAQWGNEPDACSNSAANLEGIDNTGAGRSQTTDSANPHTIPKRVTGCPHGCKVESDCLRYDQGGSIPADCPLYAIHDWPAGEDEFYAGVNEPDVTPNSVEGCPHGCKKESDCLRYDQGGSIPADCALYATLNRTAEIATFDDEVCRASKGHCGRHGCCKGDPPYEEDATPNRVLRADVADRINRLREMGRERDKARKLGKTEFSAEYLEGYEDALNDLHDALEGWCGTHFRIEDAT